MVSSSLNFSMAFKTYTQALKVIECGDVDFVGLARALVIAPELAKTG
jgi:2,4-dienoyl-CoA reductase-like NADH-dependent reductase (Old Yellow Enzyme family)